jgi:hypothetical protein
MKRHHMSSPGCAANPVGYNSSLQIKMAIWRDVLNLNLQYQVWEPAPDYNGCFARFKCLKSMPNGHYFLQRAATPDQITQQNSLQRQ